MPEVADPRGLVDRKADIALAVDGGLAGVDAHADLHDPVLRPLVGRQGALRRDGRRDRSPRAAEHEEERVALAVDLDPAVLGKGVAEQDVVLREDTGVTLAPEPLQEPRRPLDVREEKADRPGWEVAGCSHFALLTPSDRSTYRPRIVLLDLGRNRKRAGKLAPWRRSRACGTRSRGGPRPSSASRRAPGRCPCSSCSRPPSRPRGARSGSATRAR